MSNSCLVYLVAAGWMVRGNDSGRVKLIDWLKYRFYIEQTKSHVFKEVLWKPYHPFISFILYLGQEAFDLRNNHTWLVKPYAIPLPRPTILALTVPVHLIKACCPYRAESSQQSMYKKNTYMLPSSEDQSPISQAEDAGVAHKTTIPMIIPSADSQWQLTPRFSSLLKPIASQSSRDRITCLSFSLSSNCGRVGSTRRAGTSSWLSGEVVHVRLTRTPFRHTAVCTRSSIVGAVVASSLVPFVKDGANNPDQEEHDE